MEQRISFKNRKIFREWLGNHHDQEESIWVEFYKDGTSSLSYDEALEESLCFGWIDSLVKRVDERIYIQKFSKRKKKSKWSLRNKEIVDELTRKGLMTQWGLNVVKTAKENGEWYKESSKEKLEDTEGFRKVIEEDLSLVKIYDGLSEALKRHYAGYFFDAKKEETKIKRLEKIKSYIKEKKRIL